MVHIRDLFEVHLTVSDLDRSVAFYRNVLGLQVAHVAPERHVAFLWIGSAGQAMLGLWASGAAPQRVSLHVAFTVTPADVLAAPAALQSAGVTPRDFDGRPASAPVVLAWMPAAAVYFRDPDNHLLEYVAMLPQPPRPDIGVVPWDTWRAIHHDRKPPFPADVITRACASPRDEPDRARVSVHRPPPARGQG